MALGFPDTEVGNTISRDDRPTGCFVSSNDVARFNEFDVDGNYEERTMVCINCDIITTTTTTTSGSTTSTEEVVAFTAVDGDVCASAGLCEIATSETCEQAADELSMDDTVATVLDRNDKLSGCYVSPNGKLRFNAAASAVAPDSEQTKLCLDCSLSTTSTTTTTTEPPTYITVMGGTCGDEGYCTIQSRDTCAEAANELALPDTSVGVAFENAAKPPGCWLSPVVNSLRFNDALDSEAEAVGQTLVCVHCSETTTTTTTSLLFFIE